MFITMKKIIFILAITFSYLLSAQTEKLNQIFDKYQDTEGVTSIKIAKPMFSMLSKLDIQDSELDQIKPLLNKIKGLKMLVIEKPTFPKGLEQENKASLISYENLKNEIFSSVKNLNYEELVTVNSKDNKIKFLSSNATEGVLDNLLLNIVSEDNTVLMMLDGKISMEDINKLVNDIQSAPKTKVETENITSEGSTQVRNVGNFDGIEVSSGIKVNFTQDDNQYVIVETDADKQQYIATEVENGVLKISVKNHGKNNLRFNKMLVKVQAPSLKSVKTNSGATFMTINEINGDNFTLNSSSGSNISGEFNAKNKITISNSSGANQKLNLNANTIICETSSGSSSTLSGNANSVDFDSSSAANCNAQNLIAKNVVADSSSASSLKVNATESLNASSSSGSSIKYEGKPQKLIADKSSGGSVKPID